MMKVLIFLLLCAQELPLMGDVMIIGHRGSPCNAPENTLASFKKAIDAGVDFIEFDVHLTKDGIPIVTHDPQLGRTVNVCCPVGVNCLTLEDIKSYDAGVIYHQDFKGEKIPTLEEVFALAEGKVGMMIEIKTGTASESKLAEAVMSIIKSKWNGDKPIIVGSFSPIVLQRVKELDPNQKIIALAKHDSEMENHASNHPDYFGLNIALINDDLVYVMHEQGTKIWAWTVNNENQKEQMIAMGVDGLITNRPMALRICKNTVAVQSQH